MAISKGNMLLNGLSGKIGGVVIKQYKGRTVVSALPDMSGVKRSTRQQENNHLLSIGNKYASLVVNDAELTIRALRMFDVSPTHLRGKLVGDFVKKRGSQEDLLPVGTDLLKMYPFKNYKEKRRR